MTFRLSSKDFSMGLFVLTLAWREFVLVIYMNAVMGLPQRPNGRAYRNGFPVVQLLNP
jgi:hypothetical protein